MSKVLFWSPYHGLGQTSNMHVVALIAGLLHKKSVLLMQTQFRMNNLESPLVGQNTDKRTGFDHELFQGIGLDMAVTYSNLGKLTEKTLRSCCLTFDNTPVLLLPGTEIVNKETFDRDIGSSIRRMVRNAENCVDIVFVDANSGDDEISMKLMPEADLIVINLSQRRYVLDKFFSEYGDQFIDSKKVFYLFGDYNDNSSYNINNCRRKYHKYMSPMNSGVIPYCTKFMDSQNDSSMLKFMGSGLKNKRANPVLAVIDAFKSSLSGGKYAKEETDYFFHRSRLAVEKMFKLLNLTISKGAEEKV